MDDIIVVALSMTVGRFDNDMLTASYLALSLSSKIHKENLAYDTFLKEGLITEAGTPRSDQLENAVQFVINGRIKEGKF